MKKNIYLTIALPLILVYVHPGEAATLSKTLRVAAFQKRMMDGTAITFWGFSEGTGGMATPSLPGPTLEFGIGDVLNLTLNMMMAPVEPAPFNGHTIHMHGADLPTSQDGVPETNGNKIQGDTYTWTPTSEMAGSYLYHCHVHSVKHLEMGMYGALIVRPKDANGNFLNQITPDARTAFDYVQNYLFSTVDPTYHSDTAVGNSPIFSSYNPKYFLINGNEGNNQTNPAVTLTAAPGKRVSLRLIGVQSVNGTFSIQDGSGNLVNFVIWVQDGRQMARPSTVDHVEISPGQRYDILVQTPNSSGALYPRMIFKRLGNGSIYSTNYGKISF